MPKSSRLEVRIADSEQDILASKKLRYQVFAKEYGAVGPNVDHQQQIETDRFDPYVQNLILVDSHRSVEHLEHVVGVYRLMSSNAASSGCGFYSQSEFDLNPLLTSGCSLVELGRSCVHPDYRGGMAMFQLFNGVADYVIDNGIEIMFGVASFHGTDLEPLLNPLSFLRCHHLAPKDLRVKAKRQNRDSPDFLPCELVEQRTALQAIPPLIKAYLRLGGFVGDGVYLDVEFNCTDVFLLVDTRNMAEDRKARYLKYRGTK